MKALEIRTMPGTSDPPVWRVLLGASFLAAEFAVTDADPSDPELRALRWSNELEKVLLAHGCDVSPVRQTSAGARMRQRGEP